MAVFQNYLKPIHALIWQDLEIVVVAGVECQTYPKTTRRSRGVELLLMLEKSLGYALNRKPIRTYP
jgi:hypothetical protein